MSRALVAVRSALVATVALPVADFAYAQPVDEAAVDCPEGQPCLQPDGTITLDAITLSATRRQEAPIDALAGVSVVRPDDAGFNGVSRSAGLVDGVPGVTLGEDGSDQSTQINIRGLQDFGRVAVVVDGARQNFRQSGHGVEGVFLPDPWLVGRATVVRGPVANVYGSGAIGGVVAFDSIAPDDLIRPGERWAVESRASYETNGDGRRAGLRAAARVSDSFAVLGALSYGGNATLQDGDGAPITGSATDDVSGLLKAVIEPDENNRITASYLADSTRYVRDASSSFGPSAYDTDVVSQTAALRWTYDNPDDPWFGVSASAWWSGTDKTETYVYGANAGLDRSFEVGTFGVDLANTSRFDTGLFSHALTIGADAFSDSVDSVDVPGGTGAVSTPSGDRLVYGAFIQDEITAFDWLRIVGALRFDGYDFEGEDSDGNPVDGSGSRVSPKLAVGVTPFEGTFARGLEIYASYAEGYRAPSITETLVSGPHPGFVFLPNPDLRPETAHTTEIGINYARDDLFVDGDALRLKAGWFHNAVDDFIDGRIVGAPGGGMGYQYQNVKSATIRGVELEARYDMGFMFAGIAAASMRGEDDRTAEALGSVPADSVTTTLGFRFLDERLTVGGQWETVGAQTRVPSGTPESERYNLFNAFASYDVSEDLRLGLDVKNLFDTQYVEYFNDDPSPGLSVMFTLNARLGG